MSIDKRSRGGCGVKVTGWPSLPVSMCDAVMKRTVHNGKLFICIVTIGVPVTGRWNCRTGHWRTEVKSELWNMLSLKGGKAF